MDPKTTTRPNRHASQFREVRRLLDFQRFERPIEVLQVGPGLAVKHLGRLAERGRVGRDFFRLVEAAIRRVPMPDFCYESYETGELLTALDGLSVRLTILDINPRVLRIVKRSTSRAPVETTVVDLGKEMPADLAPLLGKFDLVVANAVIGRVGNGRRGDNARAILGSMVKLGGLFVGTGDFKAVGMTGIEGSPNFYRK